MTIEHVDIGIVSATAELAEFYRAVFEAEVLEPRRFPFATVHRLALGPVTLKIMVPEQTPEAPSADSKFWDRQGFRYLTLWVDDLTALAEGWARLGGTVAMEPVELRPGVWTALLVDPDGNTIEAMRQTRSPQDG